MGREARIPLFARGRLSRTVEDFLICAVILSPGLAVRAQSQVALSGVVTDSAGTPLSGARVSITGSPASALSDERGEFRLTGVAPGNVQVEARRLGFAPTTWRTQVGSEDTNGRLKLRLAALPGTLAPVLVEAGRAQFEGRLAGYYERLYRRSAGYFIAREEIDRKNYRTLSQLLGQVPGVNAFRYRGGAGSVRMRGRSCWPLVWLDGVPAPAAEVDLDAFPVSTLQGIELYLGSTTAPPDYTASQGLSSCGTILLWSRGKDTEAASWPSHPSEDLEKMAAESEIYTWDKVDAQAKVRTATGTSVQYPPSLLAAGVEGSVVAEFVIDTHGQIETGTLSIVSSTNPLFSAAVSDALDRATYTPAVKNGGEVRQLVHQRFAFRRGN